MKQIPIHLTLQWITESSWETNIILSLKGILPLYLITPSMKILTFNVVIINTNTN